MWPFERIYFPFDYCVQCQPLRRQAEAFAARYGATLILIDPIQESNCDFRIRNAGSEEDVLLLPRHTGLARRSDVDVRSVLDEVPCALWMQPVDRDIEEGQGGPVVSAVALHSDQDDHTFLALAVARLHGVPLHLLHIAPPIANASVRVGYFQRAMRALRKLRSHFDSSADLSVQTGTTAVTVAHEASACGARLLVIGRGDSSRCDENHAYRIVRNCSLPVLLPGLPYDREEALRDPTPYPRRGRTEILAA
jgi:hypothetical protein